jgi:hypothetical protein
MIELEEAQKIVQKFQDPLRFHEGDARYIALRFFYLKQKLGNGMQGFPEINVLLTSIYCYVRDPLHSRRVVNPQKFVIICDDIGFNISTRDIWRYAKLYFDQELYSPALVSTAVDYLKLAWYDISKDFDLTEEQKDDIMKVVEEAQNLKGQKRAPSVVTAAVIYIFCNRNGRYISQVEIASYFCISEVSVRSAAHHFKHLIPEKQSKLSKFLEE